MTVGPRENEIQRLVRFYRKSIEDLAKQIETIDFERPRAFVQAQQISKILDDLDDRTERWASRNIAGLFRAASSEASKLLKDWGVSPEADLDAFNLINEQAIQSLLVDPEVGFLTNMRGAVQQIRDRMRTIQNQAKMLTSRQRLFDETIARVGFLEGRNVNTVRDRLVDEMVKFKESGQLLFTQKAAKLPASEIVSNVANLPYVKIPTAASSTGFRRLRVDKYAEMLARTKTGQASNLARRNRAMEHNVHLVQISKNKPLQDDACFLYIGKVFALTAEAKQEYGVPMVNELPNGGAPFHPNCTHQELLWVPEFRTKVEARLAMVPPPAWALNRPWAEVEREYRKRGAPRSGAANQMGVDTGGRQRRGFGGDETGPRAGESEFLQTPREPVAAATTAAPEPSAEELSKFRQQIGRAVAPRAREVATSSGLARTVEGLNSDAFVDMVRKQSRGFVDDALTGITALTSRAKEAMLADLAPKLADDAVRYAKGEFAFDAMRPAAQRASRARGIEQLAKRRTLEAEENLREARRAATLDATESAPKGLGLSDDALEAQARRAVDDVFDDAIAPLKAVEKKMIEWSKANTDEIQKVAANLADDEIFGVEIWDQGNAVKFTGDGVRQAVRHRAKKVFDDPEIIDALADEFADDFAAQAVNAALRRAEELAATVTKEGQAARNNLLLRFNSTSADNKFAQQIRDDLISRGLDDAAISQAGNWAYVDAATDLRKQVQALQSFKDLPPWMADDLLREVVREEAWDKAGQKLAKRVAVELLEERATVIEALTVDAKAAAEKAVDDFLAKESWQKVAFNHPVQVHADALKSIGAQAAEKVLDSPLQALGMTKKQIAKAVDEMDLASAWPGKVQQARAKLLKDKLGAAIEVGPGGVPTEESLYAVVERQGRTAAVQKAKDLAWRGQKVDFASLADAMNDAADEVFDALAIPPDLRNKVLIRFIDQHKQFVDDLQGGLAGFTQGAKSASEIGEYIDDFVKGYDFKAGGATPTGVPAPESLINFTKKTGKPTKKSVVEAAGEYIDEQLDDQMASLVETRGWFGQKRDIENDMLAKAQDWITGQVGEHFSIDEVVKMTNSLKVRSRVQSAADAFFDLKRELKADGIAALPFDDALRRIQQARGRLGKVPMQGAAREVVTAPRPPVISPRSPIKVNKADFPASVDELKVKHRLGGSTGADLVEDSQGRLFVRKKGASADHLREEFRAEEAYRAAGVRVPESVIYETPGGPVKLSRYLDDAKPLSDLKGAAREKALAKLQEDFGTDAILGNWDVVGMNLDNVMVDSAGNVWRIDVGGSMRYRAMGALKSQKQFSAAPIELFTMDGSLEVAPGVTSNAAPAFRGMRHGSKIESLERLLANRDEVLRAIDDPDLRAIVARRLNEAQDVVDTARVLEADGFEMEEWIRGVNLHGVKMDYDGLLKGLPKKMNRKHSVVVVDEDGNYWDALRGNGSMSDRLKEYINANGGDWNSIRGWAGSQAGSSWSADSSGMKYFIVKHKGGRFDNFYWGEHHLGFSGSRRQAIEAAKRNYEEILDKIRGNVQRETGKMISREEADLVLQKSWEAWHSFNMQFLRRVAFENNDNLKKVVKLMRTEPLEVMRRNGKRVGMKATTMKRGALESTSIYQETYVYGSELTVQEVPHHRIFGNYFLERSPGSGHGLFASDGENEFVALLEDILFDYLPRRR